MKRAPQASGAYQRGGVSIAAIDPALSNSDPTDPTQRTQPAARLPALDPVLGNSDPTDPTQRTQPVTRLGEAAAAPRSKPARRDRPVRKATKRATSRRR